VEREWLVTSTPSVMHVRAGMRNQHERMPRCAAFLERSTLLHVKHGGFDRLVNVTEQHLTRLRVHLLPAPQSTVSRLFPQTWLEPSVDGGVTQLVTMGRRQSSAMEIPAAATCPVRCKPWGIQSRQRLASCFRGRGGSRARTAMKTLRFGLLGLRVGEELTTDRGVTRPCRDARRFPSIRGVSRCCGKGWRGVRVFGGGGHLGALRGGVVTPQQDAAAERRQVRVVRRRRQRHRARGAAVHVAEAALERVRGE
jgi:hypothetical protein